MSPHPRTSSFVVKRAKAHVRRAYAHRRPSLLFIAISYALWVSVSLRWVTEFIEQAHPLTGLVSAILLLYGALLGLEPALTYGSPRRGHLYLALQLALTMAAMLLFYELDFFALLLVPLTGQAAFIFPPRTAAGWVFIFLAANVVGQIHQFGWPGGVSFIFLHGAAIIFVAAFSRMTLAADAARRRSEALLEALQAAHTQLQTYADQAEELAIAQERNRLARDLHDSVAQTLYGLTLQAEAANRKLAAGHIDEVAGYLTQFRASARQTLQETRLLIFALRPPILDEVGLAAALQARFDAVERRSGVTCALDVPESLALPGPIETQLYHIAQEALNNSLKHAQAARVALSLRREDGRVRLAIRDDGVGFEPLAAIGPAYGLTSMRERAAQIGGEFNLHSAPGAGTEIVVEVPL